MAKRVTLRKSMWRPEEQPAPPAPDYGPQLEGLLDRINQVQAQMAQIPPPDMAPLMDELTDIRGEMAQLRSDMEQPAQWDFDIQRSGGRISSVTATRADKAEESGKRQVNVLDLYKT